MVYSLLDQFGDLIRSIPYALWVVLPLLAVCSGVQDFNIYRMQHIDIQGTHLGSRSAVVNMEGRSIGATMLNRKCVIIKWSQLSAELLTSLMEKGSGSILVLLPDDWKYNNITDEWVQLERHMLSLDIPIPVYLAIENEYLNEMYNKLNNSLQDDTTALGALLLSVAGEGYTLIADAVEATPIETPEISTIMGKLNGRGYDLPTVVIVTHYDSFGLAPGLSSSDGSGVVGVLELARLFSILYSNSNHQPAYNLVFVLAGGSHLNHFGLKYFIEDLLEETDNLVLSDVDYVLCLDSLAGEELFLHVSRPPREGTKGARLVSYMNKTLPLVKPSINSITLNHKKIRIGDELLAWPHERFSLKKVPGATISHFSKHTNPLRKSMFYNNLNVDSLAGSVQLIAETIGRHILGEGDNYTAPLFTEHLSVHKDYMKGWLDHLSIIGRSPQLLLSNEHHLLASLQQTLKRFVDEVSTFSHKPDKNDPEFVMYTQSESIMHSYSVKPAVFDLILALGILVYVGVIYLIIIYFPSIKNILQIKRKGD